MGRHSFIQQSNLTDVLGRIDYIQNEHRQEYLYARYETVPPEFWKFLEKQNQHDFKRSNVKGKCIEARELIIALPESFIDYDPDELLQLFTKKFVKEYGVQCISALHHNKIKSNYHIHLIYSERKLLEKTEVKYASRNMFYDENGKHVRTKKEILDSEGNIRSGCVIVPKGDIYEIRYFDAKEEVFKSNYFLDDVKHMYTDFINDLVKDESEKLTVFDRSGPYLATKKIGKNNPKEAEIKSTNALRQEWNRSIDEALVMGVPQEELVEVKRKEIGAKVQESVNKHGRDPARFMQVLKSAIQTLRQKLEKRRAPKLSKQESDIKEFQEMQAVYNKLISKQKSIRETDQMLQKKNRKLDQISGVSGMFKRKEKTQLMNDISKLTAERMEKTDALSKIVTEAGYRNVEGFMKAYQKSEKLVKEYQRLQQKPKEKKQKERASVMEKLHQYQSDAKKVSVAKRTRGKEMEL